jgi:hypothetical protein
MNLPCGVGSNQNVGDFSALIFPVSIKKIIRPPSMLFLANLSGCHAKIPSASPLSIRAIKLTRAVFESIHGNLGLLKFNVDELSPTNGTNGENSQK